MNKSTYKHAVRGLFIGLLGSLLCLSGTAVAQDTEWTPDANDDQANAQPLTVQADGTASLAGFMDAGMELDVYAFDAGDGTVPEILVSAYPNCGALNLAVALFDSNGNLLRNSVELFFNADPATQCFEDDYISPMAALPAAGTYYVAVTQAPLFLQSGYVPMQPLSGGLSGDYMLSISGIVGGGPVGGTDPGTDPLPVPDDQGGNDDIKQVTMEVLLWRGRDGEVGKRWHRYVKYHGKHKGVRPIPVAIFGGEDFVVSQIDKDSLKFGRDGVEDSLFRCSRRKFDVNRDGMKDLLCFFDADKAGFEVNDLEGKLSGMYDGGPFQSAAPLKIVKLSHDKHSHWKKGHKKHKHDSHHRGHRRHDHD